MAADDVIYALQSWLAPPAIIGLNAVYDAAPWFTDGADFTLSAELGWGAIGVLDVAHEEETRIAMGGSHGGLKLGLYQVGILVIFQQVVPQLSDQRAAATSYRRARNGLLKAIKMRLREDRVIGTGMGLDGVPGIGVTEEGAILQVGEGDGMGSPDIVIDHDLPKRDVGKIWSNSLIRLHVQEVIAT